MKFLTIFAMQDDRGVMNVWMVNESGLKVRQLERCSNIPDVYSAIYEQFQKSFKMPPVQSEELVTEQARMQLLEAAGQCHICAWRGNPDELHAHLAKVHSEHISSELKPHEVPEEEIPDWLPRDESLMAAPPIRSAPNTERRLPDSINSITTPDANWPMPFGKHKGSPIGTVPIDYLQWVIMQDWCRDEMKQRIAAEKERRKTGS